MILLEARLQPEETGLPSPLELSFRGEHEPALLFGDGVTADAIDLRYASDLHFLLYDPKAIQANDPLYAIYRNVCPANLIEEIERRGLTYVLTVLRSGTIRGTEEWVRTRGHINSTAPGTNLSYPEVHEVLHGEAWLYLQSGSGEQVDEVVVIPLVAGDKIVVAPRWASLLVNTGTKPLVVGTWRMADCAPEGAVLLEHQGMAHYILQDSNKGAVCVANTNYRSVPEPRFAAPKEMPEWGLSRTEPLLAAFHESPDYVRFLLRPQDYETAWKTLYE